MAGTGVPADLRPARGAHILVRALLEMIQQITEHVQTATAA
jgi:hypothetical protein